MKDSLNGGVRNDSQLLTQTVLLPLKLSGGNVNIVMMWSWQVTGPVARYKCNNRRHRVASTFTLAGFVLCHDRIAQQFICRLQDWKSAALRVWCWLLAASVCLVGMCWSSPGFLKRSWLLSRDYGKLFRAGSCDSSSDSTVCSVESRLPHVKDQWEFPSTLARKELKLSAKILQFLVPRLLKDRYFSLSRRQSVQDLTNR